MPATPTVDSSWDVCFDELEALPARPIEERVEVVERLIRNPLPGIREQALRVGTAVLTDEALVDYLRSGADAIVRNAGLEILKKKGEQSIALVIDLLQDPDPDIVLQAVLIIDHVGDSRALEPLRTILHHENSNVVLSAMTAIGHLGDDRVIPDLLPFLAKDLWQQMAAIQALGDLRSTEAIPPLADLLSHPMAGSVAAEAIAQIGGPEALSVLTDHWLSFRETVEPESSLELIAQTLEGLQEDPHVDPRLRPALAEHMRDPYRAVRHSAARCLLALGPGPQDGEALSVLLAGESESELPPSCLSRRTDLASNLLSKPPPLTTWGLLLSTRDQGQVSTEALDVAIRSLVGCHLSAPVLDALETLQLDECGEALLDLYLGLRPVERARLIPALRTQGATVRRALAGANSVSSEDRTILEAVLGHSTEATRRALLDLPDKRRPEVLRLILDQPDLLRALPWNEWVTKQPNHYLEIAARAAADGGLKELLPLLRDGLRETPLPGAIRAVGRLGDLASVPVILSIFDRPELSALRPIAIESLGRIGGTSAREALRTLAIDSEGIDSRLAYHALARCAGEEDDECFREAARHSDWYIRLAAVEALARFSSQANLRSLAQLAADPVSIIAQNAISTLRSK